MTYSLGQIAERLKLPLEGNDVTNLRPAIMSEAGPGTISLATSPYYVMEAESRAVSALIVPPEVKTSIPCLRAEQPRVAFAHLLNLFDDRPIPFPGRHATATISADAEVHPSVSVGPHAVIQARAVIGAKTRIGAGCYVGEDSKIGTDCEIGPNVTIYHNCILGDRVMLLAGCVIGSEGFGYEWDGKEHLHVPHLGSVVIEDDVHIGANSCVDRAKTGTTRIRKGAKLDNLVQIGHGVQVGALTLMAGQAGVGGSSVIGPGSVLAGQVGIADNVVLGAETILTGQSGVTNDLPGGETYMGMPARKATEFRRLFAAWSRLPGLLARVRAIERHVGLGKGE